jgi:hypothetical protein
VLDAANEVAKFVTVPLAGWALALSWPRCPPVARVVLHVEAMATLLRFGWGYWAAPQRLCALYLLDDQALTGAALLVIGTTYAAAGAGRALMGRPNWWYSARKA